MIYDMSVHIDFVRVAEELYAILDSKSTDQVDAVIVSAVVQQLREALTRSAEGPAACVWYNLYRIFYVVEVIKVKDCL